MQTPHACIHLEKFRYPLALVSGAPHKAYIFRFNTPTNNTFPASGTHTCLILRGYPPPSSHTCLAKSEGLTPPLCSYIIRNVGSTPPTPEPVVVGDYIYIYYNIPIHIYIYICGWVYYNIYIYHVAIIFGHHVLRASRTNSATPTRYFRVRSCRPCAEPARSTWNV